MGKEPRNSWWSSPACWYRAGQAACSCRHVLSKLLLLWVLCLPKFICWNFNPQCDGVWKSILEMDFSHATRSLEVLQVFVAVIGPEAHGYQGRVSSVLLVSTVVPRQMLKLQLLLLYFWQKRGKTGVVLTSGKQSLLRYRQPTTFWLELCPEPCLFAGEASKCHFPAGDIATL